ncbi:MAG: hypothetical protein U5J64_07900 [Halobacteriales archaeon]|nr:hypothetical protein [Halobacteriales archaeon]
MDQRKHKVRHSLAGIGKRVLPGSMYSVYSLGTEEYIGTLDVNLDEARKLLKEESYSYNVASAKKLHPDDESRSDDGSYRRLDPDNRAKQWHVHLWDLAPVEVYSHYEYKPEPWQPIDTSRTAEHYRPDYGETCISEVNTVAV